jgi:hypothetical protein
MPLHRLILPLPLLLALHGQTTQASSQQDDHAVAQRELREGRASSAYARLVRLADAGHAPSAELARVLHRNGRSLYGSDWSASPGQQRRWAALVAETVRLETPHDDLARAE